MGYTADPDDLERLADAARKVADHLLSCPSDLSDEMADWKTDYTSRLLEMTNHIADAQRGLMALATEIDERAVAARGES